MFSRGWVLLLFPGDQPTAETIGSLDRVVRQVQEAVGDEVQPYLVLVTPGQGGAAVRALLDPDREVSRVFGAREGLVALVRPDGYLGYRGRLDQPGELASYLARVFAMQLRDVQTGSARLAERMG